jgi:hypothetical protein
MERFPVDAIEVFTFGLWRACHISRTNSSLGFSPDRCGGIGEREAESPDAMAAAVSKSAEPRLAGSTLDCVESD